MMYPESCHNSQSIQTIDGLTKLRGVIKILLRKFDGHIMQALLEHFILQSALYSLIAVLLVAFLESLALVGLILPGTVMMAGLGR
jgi:hypothetical protein